MFPFQRVAVVVFVAIERCGDVHKLVVVRICTRRLSWFHFGILVFLLIYGSGTSVLSYLTTAYLHFWGSVPTAAPVSEMTYTVSSGTLNPSIPYIPYHTHSRPSNVLPWSPRGTSIPRLSDFPSNLHRSVALPTIQVGHLSSRATTQHTDKSITQLFGAVSWFRCLSQTWHVKKLFM